jgi:predicted MPP superfamily phosphohydrolase
VIKWLIGLVVGLVIGGALFWGFERSDGIEVEEIEIWLADWPMELDGFRIVQVSDLHLPLEESKLEEILILVAEVKPDMIVMTGDIADFHYDYKGDQLAKVARELSNLAPTYASSGNHEQAARQLFQWQLTLRGNGVQVLEGMATDFGPIRLVGIGDHGHFYDDWVPMTERFMILLSHRPRKLASYYDLVFSGHAHGGQVRLPFVGGVYAPDQGYFPDFTSGLYVMGDDSRVVVSRGLNNNFVRHMPRFNNPFHLPVVTLRSGE